MEFRKQWPMRNLINVLRKREEARLIQEMSVGGFFGNTEKVTEITGINLNLLNRFSTIIC